MDCSDPDASLEPTSEMTRLTSSPLPSPSVEPVLMNLSTSRFAAALLGCRHKVLAGEGINLPSINQLSYTVAPPYRCRYVHVMHGSNMGKACSNVPALTFCSLKAASCLLCIEADAHCSCVIKAMSGATHWTAVCAAGT